MTRLSWTYGRIKEHEKAIEYLVQCLEILKPSAWLFGQFAYNYYHLGNLKKANEYIKNALEMSENDQWLNDLNEKIIEKMKKPKIFRKY